MKRILLSLSLLGAALFGHSQVVLNELYTDPGSGNREFFELYNTSIDPAAINLDCYTLVTYYESGNNNNRRQGFYVLDFPQLSIDPKSYFVAASATPFNVQGGANKTAQLNWNNLLSSTTGSLKKYEKNGSSYTVTNLTTDDLFVTTGIKYGVFLFQNGTYVNGFLGSAGTSSVPPTITTMPEMNFTTNCGTYTITWANIINAEFTNAAAGNDNGFARKGDGLCGVWDKTSNQVNHTPGVANPGNNTTSTGTLISTPTIVCGTRVDFKVTSNDASAFPVEVQLYYDNNGDGKLDAGDTYQTSKTVSESSTTQTYSFPIPAEQKILLVYKTALGCFDKVVAVTSLSGDVIATITNTCNKQIDFTITGTTGTIGANLTQVTAELYQNTNGNTTIDAGEALIGSQLVNLASGTGSFNLTEELKASSYLVVFKNTDMCFTGVPKVPTNTQAALTVGGGFNSCDLNENGKRTVQYFVVTAATNPLAYPLDLYAYENYGTATQKVIGHQILSAPPASGNQGFIAELSNNIAKITIIATSQAANCANTIFDVTNSCTITPVKLSSFNASRSSHKVTLAWETTYEDNNKGFQLQRNIDGEWKNIAFVFSKAERGNSSEMLSYSYADNNSHKGISQYRLLQVDIDGKGKYSEIRSVRGEESGSKLSIFPNPSNDGKVNILFEEGTTAKDVIVSDITGRVIKQYKNIKSNNLVVDGLTDGYYTIQVLNQATATTTVEKVIVKKR